MHITKLIDGRGQLSLVHKQPTGPLALITHDQTVYLQGERLDENECHLLSSAPQETFIKMPLWALRQIIDQL